MKKTIKFDMSFIFKAVVVAYLLCKLNVTNIFIWISFVLGYIFTITLSTEQRDKK